MHVTSWKPASIKEEGQQFSPLQLVTSHKDLLPQIPELSPEHSLDRSPADSPADSPEDSPEDRFPWSLGYNPED